MDVTQYEVGEEKTATEVRMQSRGFFYSTPGVAEDNWALSNFESNYLTRLEKMSEEERREFRDGKWTIQMLAPDPVTVEMVKFCQETERVIRKAFRVDQLYLSEPKEPAMDIAVQELEQINQQNREMEDYCWQVMKEILANVGSISIPMIDHRVCRYTASLGGIQGSVDRRTEARDLEALCRKVLLHNGMSREEIDSGLKAALREIKSDRAGRGHGPLEDGAGRYGVSAYLERSGKMVNGASPASGDDGDAKRAADRLHEDKVKAAKEAIARYARDKKLPSAEQLAAFRELDEARKAAKTVVAVDPAVPGRSEKMTVDMIKKAQAVLAGNDYRGREIDFVVFDEAARFIDGEWASVEVDGYHHGLASKALSRAADKVGVAYRGSSYGDLISTGRQGLLEMFDR